jgi:hypothetical protein
MELPNARKLLRLLESGKQTIRPGELRDVHVCDGDPRSWFVNWGQGLQRFDAVVMAAGFYSPSIVVKEAGELEIGVDGRRQKNSVGISDRMNMVHPAGREEESIWFVGAPAHVRVPIPNAVFIVATLVDRVVAEMAKSSLAQHVDGERLLIIGL